MTPRKPAGTHRTTEKARLASWRCHVKKQYGMTLDEYAAFIKARDGRCEICCERADPPQLDHDHTTGKVRGLLCRRCNVSLGNFRDDPRILYAAVRYLEAHK